MWRLVCELGRDNGGEQLMVVSEGIMESVSGVFSVNGRVIGPGHPPFVIAEVSANHAGDLDKALAIIVAAKAAGADAVKLQTYTADTMTIAHDGPEFRIRDGLWDGYNLHALYQQAHTPWEWHPALFAKARELGLICFSTPFDASAIDFLESLGNPIYKIASFELTDLDLIARAAATGKPMIMSTGMAESTEISEAVAVARQSGCRDLALLHCVSSYPAPVRDANLLTIADMRSSFGVPIVGLSDHTLSPAVSVAAVALGASIIEKHFTLRRADGGPDSAFSLEPAELADLTAACRDAWEAQGRIFYGCTPSEKANLKFRRSVFVVKDIAAGECFSADNIRVIRPGYGIEPRHYAGLLGRQAVTAIKRGTPLDWSMVKA